MNNEHNPLSVRIRTVQELWLNQSRKFPDARIFVLNYKQEDNILVEGFVGVESTEHGISDDIFLVFRTHLEEQGQMLHSLIAQWIEAFSRDLETHPDWNWEEFETFKEEFKGVAENSTSALLELYLRILNSFKRFIGGEHNRLVIVLILEYIKDITLLEKVVVNFAECLPQFGAILFPEIRGQEIYTPIASSLEKKGCVLTLPDQNTAAVYKELATQGDPSDPQVQYRRLLFELGEKTSQKKKNEIKHIGETRFIPLCRSMADTQIWASAYLILGGLMMNFKEEKEYTLQTLNKGLSILRRETSEEDSLKYSDLVIQFYMYQAATYSMNDEHKKATTAFLQALEVARLAGNKPQVINCYNSVLLVLLKQEQSAYVKILHEAFEFAYAMTDEELRSINISFIVSAYLSKIKDIEASYRQTISSRMVTLYGVHWEETPQEAIRRLEQSPHTCQ